MEVRTLNSRYFKLTVAGRRVFPVPGTAHRSGGARARAARHGAGCAADRSRADARSIPAQWCGAARLSHISSKRCATSCTWPSRCICEALLGLPGVVDEQAAEGGCSEADWPVIEQTLDRGARAIWTRCGATKGARWRTIWIELSDDLEQLDQIADASTVGRRSVSHAADRAAQQDLAEYDDAD